VLRAGGRVLSVAGQPPPRTKGRSHYGIHNRLWTGLVDMLGVAWLIRRARLPDAVERSRTDARRRPELRRPGITTNGCNDMLEPSAMTIPASRPVCMRACWYLRGGLPRAITVR